MTIKNVEEAIIYMRDNRTSRRSWSDWETKFILNVTQSIDNFYALTTKQADACLALIKKYKKTYPTDINLELESLIGDPRYRLPLRESRTIVSDVRIFYDSFVLFKFAYSDELKSKFMEATKNSFFESQYIRVGIHKLWKVYVNGENYESITKFIHDNNFNFDDEFLQLIFEINKSIEMPSKITVKDNSMTLEIRNNEVLSLVLSELKWMNEDV